MGSTSHALYDWRQVNSPRAAPFAWQVAVTIGLAAAAWALTRPTALPEAERVGTATMAR